MTDKLRIPVIVMIFVSFAIVSMVCGYIGCKIALSHTKVIRTERMVLVDAAGKQRGIFGVDKSKDNDIAFLSLYRPDTDSSSVTLAVRTRNEGLYLYGDNTGDTRASLTVNSKNSDMQLRDGKRGMVNITTDDGWSFIIDSKGKEIWTPYTQ